MKSPYQELSFKIGGVAPLLMHNGQLADPLNPFTKRMAALHGKRGQNKTDADIVELGRREWDGSLYTFNGTPCIPGEVLEAMLIKGAGTKRKTKQAKAGLIVEEDALLIYDGPKDLDELWEDGRFRFQCGARVGQSRVQRVRPRFDEWELEFTVSYLPAMLNGDDIRTFLIAAGQEIGLGDWRPKFGRFTVVH